MYNGIVEVIDQFQPEAMAVEQLYAHYDHPRTAILMGHARGVIFLAAAQRGMPVRQLQRHAQVKKTVTGNGRASKEQVQRTIQRELGLAAACPSRPMWPTPWRWRCVITTSADELAVEREDRGFMITKITGMLNRVLDEEVRLQVGALEYQVLVPEFVRRTLAACSIGQEITLHTSHYLDGNPMQGRVVPRLIGFATEAELDFFELFCTVDKVGIRKAIKALVRPIKEIADAIQRQDAKWLTTLPGVGAATAEQIVATLRRKVTKFALMAPRRSADGDAAPTPASTSTATCIEDAYQALMSVGHSPHGGPQSARQGAGRRQDRSSRSRRCCWRFIKQR